MRASALKIVNSKQLTVDRIKKIVLNAVKEQSRDVIDLQKDQLQAGLLDRGDEIQPPYAKRTVAKKKKKGQSTDRVTLYDKGAFYRNMKLQFTKDAFSITSSNQKKQKIVDKYDGGRNGGDVFGLTDESREVLKQEIRPLIEDGLRDLIIRKRK